MTNVPTAPPSTATPTLPPWLQKKNVVTNYADMMVSPPKAIRASVSKKGKITFATPEGVEIPDKTSLNGVIMAFGRPRAYWQEKGSTTGTPPDCKADDGVTGQGTHVVQIGATSKIPDMNNNYIINNTEAVMNVVRDCKTCPQGQFGSGEGNSQACKQMIRLGMYIPTVYPTEFSPDGQVSKFSNQAGAESISPWWSEANKEDWPTKKAPPLIFTITPTGIREFEAYMRWLSNAGAPMEAFWTTIEASKETKGQWEVGVPKFKGDMMNEGSEWYFDYAVSLRDHPVVADIKAAGGADDYVTD